MVGNREWLRPYADQSHLIKDIRIWCLAPACPNMNLSPPESQGIEPPALVLSELGLT
jgi:hypothetical protein